MKIKERMQKPTPTFFRIVRNVSVAIAAIGGVLAAAPVALPAALITLGGYLITAGTVGTIISQCVTEEEKVRKKPALRTTVR